MVEEAVPDRLVVAALEEILDWEELARSPSLQRFLRHVVETKLEGRSDSIKAYSIAVDVFDRPPDFDPQTDPIVRVQAGRLRKLLSRFYTYGHNTIPVRIALPVGSYVPTISFARIGSRPLTDASAEAEAALPSGLGLSSPLGRWRIATLSLVGLMVIFVVFAAVLYSYYGSARSGVPLKPRLLIAEFSNLTDDPGLDAPLSDIGLHIATDLSRFDLVAVRFGELIEIESGGIVVPSDYRLSGIARDAEGGVEVTVFLARGPSDDAIWSMTASSDGKTDLSPLVNSLASKIAGRLGDYRGPLHADTRNWIDANPDPLVSTTPYLCLMRFHRARDTGDPVLIGAALSCAENLLKTQPDSATALAIKAATTARQVMRTRPVDELPEVALFDAIQSARRAVDLAPDSSFTQEQFGRVLALSGNYEDAKVAFQRALDLNPVNVEIKANAAWMLLATGDFETARALADEALADLSATAPWYHIVPMLDDFRNENYEEALFGAITVMEGEDEIGLVVAVAAGALASRSDISQRYLPELLASPALQEAGIMPWVALHYSDPDLLNRLRLGLQLGGVPLNARDRPYSRPAAESE